MSERDISLLLEDIKTAILSILTYTADYDAEKYEADVKTIRLFGILYNFGFRICWKKLQRFCDPESIAAIPRLPDFHFENTAA